MQKELLSAYMDGEEVSAELTEQLCRIKIHKNLGRRITQ